MNSSNSTLLYLATTTQAIDPGFQAVVSFNFYDGPESGLAIFAAGNGIRFDAISESESREQRAYELVPLEKADWWPAIAFLWKENPDKRSTRVWVPDASPELTILEQEVFASEPKEIYLSIGDLYLERLLIIASERAAVANIRKLAHPFPAVAALFD